MRITVVQADITTIEADAIVNAANSSLLGGGGVDGAIHRAAGPHLLEACRELRRTTVPDGLAAGDAVATPGFNLPARWVIHTVGPVFARSTDRSEILASCYRQSLRVADEVGAASVAFPAISAGIYGWPLESATTIGVSTVKDADTAVETVIFVAYSASAYRAFRAAAGHHV